MKLLFVQGTWSWGGDDDSSQWWHPQSRLVAFLATLGFGLLHPEDYFAWSTDLNGVSLWRRWFGRKDSRRDWRAGGKSLRWWITAKGVDPRSLVIWGHSHGLAVILEAAAEWHEPIFCDTLVTFGSPLRADHPWDRALPRIRRWLIVTDSRDRTQFLGRIGDCAIGSFDKLPENVEILVIDGVEHSRLLRDPSCFPLLVERGVIAFTRGGAAAAI